MYGEITESASVITEIKDKVHERTGHMLVTRLNF